MAVNECSERCLKIGRRPKSTKGAKHGGLGESELARSHDVILIALKKKRREERYKRMGAGAIKVCRAASGRPNWRDGVRQAEDGIAGTSTNELHRGTWPADAAALANPKLHPYKSIVHCGLLLTGRSHHLNAEDKINAANAALSIDGIIESTRRNKVSQANRTEGSAKRRRKSRAQLEIAYQSRFWVVKSTKSKWRGAHRGSPSCSPQASGTVGLVVNGSCWRQKQLSQTAISIEDDLRIRSRVLGLCATRTLRTSVGRDCWSPRSRRHGGWTLKDRGGCFIKRMGQANLPSPCRARIVPRGNDESNPKGRKGAGSCISAKAMDRH